jgi:hypothetical protein
MMKNLLIDTIRGFGIVCLITGVLVMIGCGSVPDPSTWTPAQQTTALGSCASSPFDPSDPTGTWTLCVSPGANCTTSVASGAYKCTDVSNGGGYDEQSSYSFCVCK